MVNNNTKGNENVYELSLVIPFYNEESNVKKVVQEIVDNFNLNKINYEIIAVDNGSTDGTRKIIKGLNKSNPRIKLSIVRKNIGYGNGIISGINQANGNFIGYHWGDGQVPSKYITEVFNKIKEGDYHLGKITRIYREYSLTRKIASNFYNTFFPLLFGVNSKDINGCPKIMKGSLLKNLELESKDWFIDAEIMIKAKRNKFKLVEVPAEYKKRTGGKSKVRSNVILEFLRNMIRFKLKGY